MNLVFNKKVNELEEGIGILAKKLGFTYSYEGDGVKVNIENTGKDLSIALEKNEATISYNKPHHFFRALGILIKTLKEGKSELSVCEKARINKLGAMFDTSRHAALNVKTIKNYIENMALMGYSEMYLYMEDTYEVEGYPYFGYLRGRYSYDELKECDSYAQKLGIEIIPAIQTLGHLLQVFKKGIDREDAKMIEAEDLIRIGEEKSYEFIEKLIVAASSPFRSKRIHLGMDEAFALGQKRDGVKTGNERTKLLIEHIEAVCKIVKKQGLEPIIWSDMLIRFASKTFEYYDKDAKVDKELMKTLSEELSIMYEDSKNETEEGFSEFISHHMDIGRKLVIAPAISQGDEFSFNYNHMYKSAEAAVLAAEKANIDELVAVSWGDGGAALSNVFSLYWLFRYSELVYDSEIATCDEYFKLCTSCNAEIFKEISKLDYPIEKTEDDNLINATKYIFRQDILMGMYDYDIKHVDWKSHYEKIQNRLTELLDEAGEYRELTEFYILFCDALYMKATIGNKLKKAYDEKDKYALAQIANADAPKMKALFEKASLCFNKLWRRYNKPFAIELMDRRFGNTCARLDTLKSCVGDYLSGKISAIAELEEERRAFNRIDKAVTCRNDITYGTPKGKVASAYGLGRY